MITGNNIFISALNTTDKSTILNWVNNPELKNKLTDFKFNSELNETNENLKKIKLNKFLTEKISDIKNELLSLSIKKEINSTEAKPIPIFPMVLTILFKKFGINSKFENDVRFELLAICCKSML